MKFLAMSVIASVVFFGCAQAQQGDKPVINSSATSSKDFQPKAFQSEMTGKEVLLIDVRTPAEFADGHLSQAINIDWNGSDFVQKVQQLDKTKPVFVYCAVGGRSSKAKSKLVELGFKEVHNLIGGFDQWSAEGLPFDK